MVGISRQFQNRPVQRSTTKSMPPLLQALSCKGFQGCNVDANSLWVQAFHPLKAMQMGEIQAVPGGTCSTRPVVTVNLPGLLIRSQQFSCRRSRCETYICHPSNLVVHYDNSPASSRSAKKYGAVRVVQYVKELRLNRIERLELRVQLLKFRLL
jgi:hypothetical protein